MADTTSTTSTGRSATVATTTTVATAPDGGRTVIDDGVVGKVAGIAARDVPGVHALGSNTARAIGAFRDAIGQRDLAQGVKVEVGERQVAADVTIVAEYPVPLQELAAAVRSAVSGALTGIVGMEVTEVNVTVQDVFIPGDDDTDDEPKESRVA